MTAFLAPTEPVLGATVLRGLPTRRTNLMEAFQTGVVSALAAAAGCKSVADWSVDDGVDMTLTHSLAGERVSVDLQLKATSSGWNAANDSITVSMSRTRFDELRSTTNSAPTILVVMDLPKDQADWASVIPPETKLQHAIYWRSLRGEPPRPGQSKDVSVSVAAGSVFDDHVICQIMARLRAGGVP